MTCQALDEEVSGDFSLVGDRSAEGGPAVEP